MQVIFINSGIDIQKKDEEYPKTSDGIYQVWTDEANKNEKNFQHQSGTSMENVNLKIYIRVCEKYFKHMF